MVGYWARAGECCESLCISATPATPAASRCMPDVLLFAASSRLAPPEKFAGGARRARATKTWRMSILSELRYPTKWYAKLLTAAVAFVFFAILSTAAVSGFLVYRIVSPPRTKSDINTRDFPGHPNAVSFTVPRAGSREGWFFPGLRGAPTIVLCHGYQSSRGVLLTLASALQDHQYNVFLFDFAGHGSG